MLSDAVTDFISGKCKEFFWKLDLEQAVVSLFIFQGYCQAEVCFKFIKRAMKKCFEAILTLTQFHLHIRSTLIGPGLLAPQQYCSTQV